MRDEDIKYFSEFLAEFQKETDRGAALVGAALIDTRLEAVLRSHFLESKIVEDLIEGGKRTSRDVSVLASNWVMR